MKKHLHNSLRALFLSLSVLMSLPMLAVKVRIDGINYDLNVETKQAAVVSKSDKYSGEVVIPESVEHEGTAYSVTSIGDEAFRGCSALTSVTIPNSVTSIGDMAFWHCSGLTSVTLPNSVTSIGEGAFSACDGLTSVTIPNSVTSIGDYAFSACDGLTSIVVEEGNSVYDSRNNCNAIVETASNSLICGCNTSIIPNSVTSIGLGAFSACDGLTSVTIPNSVTNIGDYAFDGCDGLTSVTIGNSVTSIGGWAFWGCSGLTSVTLPNSVTSIGEGAFQICSGLTSVTIPNSVTSIGNSVFSGCSALKSVTIPNGVTSIGNSVFSGCSALKSVTIPNSVTSIGVGAFSACDGLTSVTIPNSVTSIGLGAFSSCYGLTSVTIGNSVTSIGDRAFCFCSGLTSVSIGNSVKSIGEYAFFGCSGLTSVTIPNSVTSIGSYAFYTCSELLDVYCYAENVPSTESNAFSSSPIADATLHVPAASIDSYKTTEPWSSFGKIVGLSGEEPEQPEVEKCDTPIVTYAEGKLSFSCETEGAEFVTEITDSDIKKHYDAEIELSLAYNIEVYATKANYENSDTVSVALVWVENGDTDVETGIISVEAAPVLIQGNGGVLSVSGLAKDTEVVVYTISGTEVARATATDGTATISTGLQSGTIVVVKFGNKSVKVRI